MRNTNNLKNRFVKQIISRDVQKDIKGGFAFSLSDDQKDMLGDAQEAMKMARDLCKKAWKKAQDKAKDQGYTLKRDNGNGNGIW